LGDEVNGDAGLAIYLPIAKRFINNTLETINMANNSLLENLFELNEKKQKLIELALKGQKRFKIRCERQGIDYERLSEDEIMEMMK